MENIDKEHNTWIETRRLQFELDSIAIYVIASSLTFRMGNGFYVLYFV